MVGSPTSRQRRGGALSCAVYVGAVALCLLSSVASGAQVGAPAATTWTLDTTIKQREYDARTFASVDYLNPDLEYSDKKLEIKGQHFIEWNERQENVTVLGVVGEESVIHSIQPTGPGEEDAAYVHNRSAQLAANLKFASRVPRTEDSDFQRKMSKMCFGCLRYACENAKSYIRRYSRYCCLKVVQDQFRQEVGCFRRKRSDRSGRNTEVCYRHKADWNECVDVVMAGPCSGCDAPGFSTTDAVRVDTHHGVIKYDHLPNGVHAHTYTQGDARIQRGVGIGSDVIA